MSKLALTERYLRAGAIAAVLAAITGCTANMPMSTAGAIPFPETGVHFEQNATDGDAEIVFEAKAVDEGLSRLQIVAPDGRMVVNFTAPESTTMGMRQFRFESPEPRNVAALKAAYPQGTYRFTGRTFDGVTMTGTARLNHALPEPVEFAWPTPNAEDVPIGDLIIKWRPAAGTALYIVEIDQDELSTKLTVTLPGASTEFHVPSDFLDVGHAYRLAIGSVSPGGNISFVETMFTTEEE
jgi:hypothetical protein